MTGAVVVSADMYPGLYYQDGQGKLCIRVELLGQAHGACLRAAIEALQAGKSVVVDNTNTTVVEVAPYVALAQAFSVSDVALLRMNCDPEKAWARNSHGVPRDGVMGQFDRLESFEAPYHWQFVPGWKVVNIQSK